ncbi:hypothetical protein [Actinomadura sp. DC4]|uniref:hypothetical protein n=1 Tax=Actinomadura sp. DC4 TaxID=3055069 RepID=UPI0025B081DE|nr:hypothetical protein [Actinomadura sp. DC4]MDN3356885.1 hypothetical protein [Actinomadura sp. DC4]
MMPGLLRAWGGALLVLLAGIAVMIRLTPRVVAGASMPMTDQALRIHLPWFVTSAVMVVAAGALRGRSSPARRSLLATLPVPGLAVLTGTLIGVAGATSALPALLYLGDGVLGIAAGLLVIGLFARREEALAYPYPG